MAPPLYTPLSKDQTQIRLLTLLPGVWDDEITSELRLYSIHDLTIGISRSPRHDLFRSFLSSQPDQQIWPTYEALPYVWGQSHKDRTILVNGQTFCVTDNLFDTFRRIRLKNEPKAIWIDQICINQRGRIEKGRQVELMGAIYKNAERVLLWLGEPSSHSDPPETFINHLFFWGEAEIASPDEGANRKFSSPGDEGWPFSALYKDAGCLGEPSEFSAADAAKGRECSDVKGMKGFVFYCTGEGIERSGGGEHRRNGNAGGIMQFLLVLTLIVMMFFLIMVLSILTWVRKYGGSMGKVIEAIRVSSLHLIIFVKYLHILILFLLESHKTQGRSYCNIRSAIKIGARSGGILI